MATGYVLDGNEYDDELNHAVTFRQLLTVRITVHHIVHCAIVAPGLFKLFRSRNMRYSLRRHVRTAATVPVMAAGRVGERGGGLQHLVDVYRGGIRESLFYGRPDGGANFLW